MRPSCFFVSDAIENISASALSRIVLRSSELSSWILSIVLVLALISFLITDFSLTISAYLMICAEVGTVLASSFKYSIPPIFNNLSLDLRLSSRINISKGWSFI